MKNQKRQFSSNVITMRRGSVCYLGLLLIFMQFFAYQMLLPNDFELVPTRINFLGAVSSGKNIIVYGDNGVYLLSTNMGDAWEQRSIGIFDEIREITNFNDSLWGITDNGYLILSTDNGLSWKLNKLELDSNEKLVSLIVTDSTIFVRSRKSVMRINRDYRIEKIITDTALEIQRYSYYTEPDMPPYHYYSTKGMCYWNNKLIIYNKDFADSGFVIMNSDFTGLKYIAVKDKIRSGISGSYSSRKEYFPRGNYEYKGKSVFQFDAYLYFPNDDLTQWTYFFIDTSFMNYRDSITYAKWIKYANLYTYFFKDNELYALFGRDYVLDGTSYYEIGINRYESSPRDTFVQVGNVFKDIYLTGSYDNYFKKFVPGSDIVLGQLWFQKPTIIFDSVLIFIGNKKLIVISKGFGKYWELISYLSGKPKVIVNDSMYYFVNDRESLKEINRTYNKGAIALPTKPTKRALSLLQSNSSFGGYSYLTFFYFNDAGKSFAKGHQPWDPQFFLVTNNFWEDIDAYILEKFNLGYQSIGFSVEQFTSNVTKISDKFFFTKSDTISQWWDIGYRTFACYLDTSFEKYDEIMVDTLAATFHIIPESLNEFTAFCYVNNPSDYTDYTFEIRKYFLQDSNFTFTTLHKIDSRIVINQIYEHNSDSIFITFKQPDQLYLYDRTRDTLQLLWAPENDEWRNPLLMVISDRFYLVGRELFLENTNRSDLTQWREGKWDYGKPNFESVIFKGNVAIAGLSDSLRPFNYYKITLKKDTTTSVEDSQIDVRYYTTHFYATEPYPLPAHNIVKSKIYTDGSFDLIQAIDGVYDVMGNRVEGKQRITIKELGKATAEMTWNCSGVPSGIYFIVVRHNGQADTIPVIVE